MPECGLGESVCRARVACALSRRRVCRVQAGGHGGQRLTVGCVGVCGVRGARVGLKLHQGQRLRPERWCGRVPGMSGQVMRVRRAVF
jgi:hypothetical protein